MNCIKCGGKSTVVETRLSPGETRRRRQCTDCGYRWTTYEMAELTISQVRTLRKLHEEFTDIRKIMDRAIDRIDSAIVS